MTTLHLIRHGETDWNAEGRVQGQMESVLSELGQHQARELQKNLQAFNFDQVYCSASTRTRQTADLALSHMDQAFTYLNSLKEIYLARWEGFLYAEIETQDPVALNAFRNTPDSFDVDGAETFADLQRRALTAVTSIIQQHRGQEVVIVSHGAWIKSVLCHYEGRPLSEFWEPPRMHNCCHSIIKIAPDDGGTIIRYADLSEGF